MSSSLERFRTAMDKLISDVGPMAEDLRMQHRASERQLTDREGERHARVKARFISDYQRWYSAADAVVAQILPARHAEFSSLYLPPSKRLKIDFDNYRIQDFLLGLRMMRPDSQTIAVVSMLFNNQIEIVKLCQDHLEIALYDIRQITRADLFDSEVESARHLLRNGFLRAAGAVAGVVLERHLAEVCARHGLKSRKANPTIGDFNDLLKSADVVDIPTWRNLTRLGDLRNLCDHNKGRDPTRDEVDDLIAGVDKTIKELY